jgi:hypothetical protein
MKALLLPAVLGGLLAATPLQAQVFKCKGPSGVVYQDGPCEAGAAVDTRSSRGVASPKSAGKGEGAGSGAIQTKPTHPVVPERMRR